MRVMSLFAGIGGFDLAARWMGWESKVMVEWNPFCQKVLHKNFPEAEIHGDITTFDGTPYRDSIDFICGGFPCQPYSVAGKRLGNEDERHLWPQMLRVIREVQPAYVVGENVGGLLNWNEGLVFNEVCAALEAEGYEVQSFVLPACGVNAPHKRDRVWIVAHARSNGYRGNNRSSEVGCQTGASSGIGHQRERVRADVGGNGTTGLTSCPECQYGFYTCAFVGQIDYCENCDGGDNYEEDYYADFSDDDDADTGSSGRQELNTTPVANGTGHSTGLSPSDWSDWPTQPPLCGGNDGVPSRVDGHNRIKAMGNAIVPQVAYQIFQAIEQACLLA